MGYKLRFNFTSLCAECYLMIKSRVKWSIVSVIQAEKKDASKALSLDFTFRDLAFTTSVRAHKLR